MEVMRSDWILDIFGRDNRKELLWLGVRFSKALGLEEWCHWMVLVSLCKDFLSACSVCGAGLSMLWEALGNSLEGKLTSFGLLGPPCEGLLHFK